MAFMNAFSRADVRQVIRGTPQPNATACGACPRPSLAVGHANWPALYAAGRVSAPATRGAATGRGRDSA